MKEVKNQNGKNEPKFTKEQNDAMYMHLVYMRDNMPKAFGLLRIGDILANPKRNNPTCAAHIRERRNRVNDLMRMYRITWSDVKSYCKDNHIKYEWINV